MFRNQYDSDVTVWSPQGRLHQVEYAMEAVKLGSATVALKSRDYALLVALPRNASDLAASQVKINQIDDHLGISFAGITADARSLASYLRSSCISYKYVYDNSFPVDRLMGELGCKMQSTTQRYDRRPYGVGLLVAGYDDNGPHVFQITPSANYLNCKAMSIGSRSQSARTYLERHLSVFPDCSKDELICHGIQAIRGTLPNDDLVGKDYQSPLMSLSIAIVGKDQPFTILNETETLKYINMAKEKGAAPVQSQPGDDAATPPEVDDGPDPPAPSGGADTEEMS
ncbi:proteasome subunit alpha type-1 [Teleopsis dalmanni]|uniref:proteasome subunit alpha type-1 n=1 Tax=Teleopsis dalmanni TaxID=139649 RepID=UPI0018CD9173|nr:proteasome subunit alpha type-1 [Teleopsis dalmanni]